MPVIGPWVKFCSHPPTALGLKCDEWAERWPTSDPCPVPNDLVDIVKPGDLIAPVLWYIQDALDITLRGRLEYRVRWDREQGRPIQSYEPKTLIEAIYLQFAETVAGRRRQQKCQGCGRWFELAPGVNRADRLTCTSACRQRAHRGRVARARELYAEGRSVKAIAAVLGSDPATIKGWVLDRRED
jgi:hypothetical protein